MKTTVGQFPGRAQPITHIAPTRRGMSWAAWAFLIAMRRISKLTMARDLKFIHFARWQHVRVRKLPRLSPLQPEEKFGHDFFMFATNYNGDWHQYIDTFARVPRVRRGMWWLWRFSQGYPGPFPIRTFKEWIHYHTYPELLYYNAYPHSTVRNIEAALAVKEQIERFMDESVVDETGAEFKERYQAMVRSIAPYLASAPGLPPAPPPTSPQTTPSNAIRYPAGTPKTRRRRGHRYGSRTGPLEPILGFLAGQAGAGQSCITALSPIEVKPAHEATAGIVDLIGKLNAGGGPNPFARCPMLHMARLVIIDDLRPALGTTSPAALKTNYVLFMADVDGPVDDFLDCLYATDYEFVKGVWGRCLGYPDGRDGPLFFRRYIQRCMLPVQLPFVAFPGHTAVEIQGALQLHANLLEWIADVRSADTKDDDLKRDWQRWLDQFVVGSGIRR